MNKCLLADTQLIVVDVLQIRMFPCFGMKTKLMANSINNSL